jgi:fibronectin-binding autotransporter adhesin
MHPSSSDRLCLLSPALLLLSLTAPALTITWDGNGTGNAGGNWSTGLNWDSDVNPGPGASDTAVLPDVTSGTRTVVFDTGAGSPVQQIEFSQSTAGAVNRLDFVRSATVSNAITLGAAAGTEEIRISPSTTEAFILTTSGGLTINAGGLLTMGANNNGTTQRQGNLAGNLTLSGGSVFVQRSTLTTSSNQREVAGNFTMTSGTITLDNASNSQTRLRAGTAAAHAVSISGGSILRSATTGGGGAQLVSGAGTFSFAPASFDTGASLSFDGNYSQAVSLGTAAGEVLVRGTGSGSYTKTVSSSATVGRLSFGVGVANATTVLQLGSNLTVSDTPANSSMPQATFGANSATVNYVLDPAGFTLNLTAARSTGGSTTWTPGNVSASALVNWSLNNSGTPGQGGVKVGNVSFTSANQVNVGAGAVLEITGGNSTAINAGGGGTWDAASLLHYSGTAAAGTPATLTSNRAVGDLLVSGGGYLHLLSGSAANAYENDITVRRGGLIVGANGLLGGAASASAIRLGDGTSTANERMVLQLGNGIVLDRPVTTDAPLGPGANSSFQRPRITLAGVAAAGTVSADITFGLSSAGTATLLELTSVDPGSTLTVSGQIKPPVGQLAAGRLLVNGGSSGTGTVKLTHAANSFTGGLNVINGTLILPGNVPAAGASYIGVNGTLDMADGGTAEGAVVSVLMDGPHTFSRVIQLNNNLTAGTTYTAVVGTTAPGTSTYSGDILGANDTRVKNLRLTAPAGGTLEVSGNIGANAGSGVVNLEKVGDGLARLSGVNAYDGVTQVSDGTLEINGTHTGGGLITVAAGATLGGGGDTGAAVVVADNANLAPGSALADNSLAVQALTLGTAAGVAFDLGTPGPGLIPANDFIAVAGGLTLGGTLLVTPLTGFGTPAGGETWLLMTHLPGGLSGSFSSISAPGLAPGLAYAIDSSVDGQVFLTVVPEAGTGTLLLAGLAALLRRRRSQTVFPR